MDLKKLRQTLAIIEDPIVKVRHMHEKILLMNKNDALVIVEIKIRLKHCDTWDIY